MWEARTAVAGAGSRYLLALRKPKRWGFQRSQQPGQGPGLLCQNGVAATSVQPSCLFRTALIRSCLAASHLRFVTTVTCVTHVTNVTKVKLSLFWYQFARRVTELQACNSPFGWFFR